MNLLIEEKKFKNLRIDDGETSWIYTLSKIQYDNDPQLHMVNAIDGLKQSVEKVVFVRNKGDTSNNVHVLHDKVINNIQLSTMPATKTSR